MIKILMSIAFCSGSCDKATLTEYVEFGYRNGYFVIKGETFSDSLKATKFKNEYYNSFSDKSFTKEWSNNEKYARVIKDGAAVVIFAGENRGESIMIKSKWQ